MPKIIKLSVKYLILLFAASAVIFLCLEMLPGDIAQVTLGTNADAATVAALRHQLGLDRPLPIRYLMWLADFCRLDFGTSYIYQTPVATLLGERLCVTLPLTLLALTGATLLAVICATISCLYAGSWLDKALMFITQLGIAIANFWLAFLLILVFAVWLRWLPAGGFVGWQTDFWSSCRALVLPTIALGAFLLAVLTRNLRTKLMTLRTENFTVTAMAKGLSPRYIVIHHLLINTAAPMLTIIGLQFANLLAGAIVIEQVFSLPGVGQLLLSAIYNRDLELLRSCLLWLVIIVIAINFITNYLHSLIDTRLTDRL